VAPEYSAYEDEPWILKLVDFTKKVLAQDRVRIIGICFGHQILGRALEVPVGKSDKGWEISVCDFDLTARGQELFGKKRVVCQCPGKSSCNSSLITGFIRLFSKCIKTSFLGSRRASNH